MAADGTQVDADPKRTIHSSGCIAIEAPGFEGGQFSTAVAFKFPDSRYNVFRTPAGTAATMRHS
jgi:hypothetical protein